MKKMHYSVLLKESIDGLNIKDGGTYVDCTLGYAGHSKVILENNKKGKLFAFDEDENAVKYSKEALSSIGDNFTIFKENFANLKETLEKENILKVDGFLFDLGFSSPQIDDAKRGFSFKLNAPLDMRMDTQNSLTAKDVVNTYSLEKLTDIFFKYAEEKYSKVIASAICKERKNKEIVTTFELVDIIQKAVGASYFYKNHPEREIFQAIRIEVNNELSVIEKALPDAIDMLSKGGRICVITFHSLEDRLVKQIFKKYSEVDDILKGMIDIPDEYKPKIKIINKKPILPTDEEINENSRSHSAKLRIVERI
jgi:16S rRNA (cytosine1402-N4)-methyltransferase